MTERFHLINKTEAESIDARNKLLAHGFSFAPFNSSIVTHPLFDQLWPSVKRRLFVVNANHAFHLLDRSETSSTSPTLVTPLSIRSPSPSSSIRAKRSSLPPTSSPTQAAATKGTSCRERSATASPVLQDDDEGDDDDDVPLIHNKKVTGFVYSMKYCLSCINVSLEFSEQFDFSFKGFSLSIFCSSSCCCNRFNRII